MKTKLIGIILLALFLSCGIAMNILACTIFENSNWWPIFTVFAYLLAPLPNMIASRSGKDMFDRSNGNIEHLAMFLTGALITSGFGIPVVLLHGRVIEPNSMALSLSGGILVYGSLIAYLHFFESKSEDEEMFI
eukprot:TRINITY_DN10941_c0_g1_i1.p4 TRINITY_DN10941_c0_g1~~TRINITY_DN10941_c0_g1_i1.p4  ORF type:complete len:134 (+),score=36.76 TRINITY_DN10941_c0_g1_i1:87-488(+)